jgi:hypothetical protein
MRTLEEAGTANAERIVASRLKDVPAKYRADKTVTDLGKHRQRKASLGASIAGQSLHQMLETGLGRMSVMLPLDGWVHNLNEGSGYAYIRKIFNRPVGISQHQRLG